ncbi:hypothetical protein BH11ACT8_BH11ACT8_23250 [soil metagenome]
MAKDNEQHQGGHPIGVAVLGARESFTALVDRPTWSLGGAQTRDLLVEATALAAQVAELQARLLSHADTIDAVKEVGAGSTSAWLAVSTRMTRRTAGGAARLAGSLAKHDLTREALGRGEVLVEQAGVIIDAVDALPDDRGVRELCEKHLLAEAAHHDAADLKVLGQRVLALLDPDAADAHEAKLLDEEERAAQKKTKFTLADNGDGTRTGRFTIPSLYADMLRKALNALAAPKHVRANGETYDHERPTPERMGQAFCEYIGRYPAEQVPHAGGVAATVVVTMDLDTLLGGIKAASLDTGTTITAATARRLACEAGLIPAVLNGKSKVLDLGRRTRFHTEAQRLAIALEQQHCQHPMCAVPAWLCHVHHTTPWATGGETTTTDAVLLCPFHHQQAHARAIEYPIRT